MNIYKWITVAEKGILILIAFFTLFSVSVEMYTVMMTGKITLTDLLLMFIYAEVLGMLAAFYSSHRIPITIPLFIAMTALSRLIILQGKDGNPAILLYESGAIIMIAAACWIISRVNIDKENE